MIEDDYINLVDIDCHNHGIYSVSVFSSLKVVLRFFLSRGVAGLDPRLAPRPCHSWTPN